MARWKFAASTASLSRSRMARHSPGAWRRSNGSRPPGPSTTSIPAAEAGARTARKPRLPSSASNRWPPSTRRHGPRLTQSAAARGMPSVSATAAVSSSPAPARHHVGRPPRSRRWCPRPGPRPPRRAGRRAWSARPAGRRPARSAGRSPGRPSRPAEQSGGRRDQRRPGRGRGRRPATARPVLPRRAVAASAAAARSTANRSSTSASPEAVPNTRTAPTGQPAMRAQAARSGTRRPSASTHGSSGPAPAAPAIRPAGPRRRWSSRARARLTVTASPASRRRARAGRQRHRVGQQVKRVAGRAHLDREQRHAAAAAASTWSMTGQRRRAAGWRPEHPRRPRPAPRRPASRPPADPAAAPRPGRTAARRDHGHRGSPPGGWRCPAAGFRRRAGPPRAGPARVRRAAAGAGRRRPRRRPAWRRRRPARAAARRRRHVGDRQHGGFHGAQRGDPGLGDRARRPAARPGGPATAAPRSESADPFRPRVGTRPAPRICAAGQQHDLGGGVAHVHPGDHRHRQAGLGRTRPGRWRAAGTGEPAPGVDLGGLGDQGGAARQPAGGQRLGQRGQLGGAWTGPGRSAS